jgi:hypothetical protein
MNLKDNPLRCPDPSWDMDLPFVLAQAYQYYGYVHRSDGPRFIKDFLAKARGNRDYDKYIDANLSTTITPQVGWLANMVTRGVKLSEQQRSYMNDQILKYLKRGQENIEKAAKTG